MANLTKEAIKKSLIKLLNERPINKITVKDIVEDCGINRNSFYYHFDDIPSLLEEMINREADRIIAEHSRIESIEECLEVAVSFALENKKVVLHIHNSPNREIYESYLWRVCEHVVRTYFNTVFADRPIDEADKEILIRYHKCEGFGQIIDWL
ncbi:MAG TPA: TetR/AcrR family transcriptional regulator, partial [Ruminococcus flavefaciens]|nr:TetR/AcrR family transcriptional regulator [Ruminococcus flavefaciens]